MPVKLISFELMMLLHTRVNSMWVVMPKLMLKEWLTFQMAIIQIINSKSHGDIQIIHQMVAQMTTPMILAVVEGVGHQVPTIHTLAVAEMAVAEMAVAILIQIIQAEMVINTI